RGRAACRRVRLSLLHASGRVRHRRLLTVLIALMAEPLAKDAAACLTQAAAFIERQRLFRFLARAALAVVATGLFAAALLAALALLVALALLRGLGLLLFLRRLAPIRGHGRSAKRQGANQSRQCFLVYLPSPVVRSMPSRRRLHRGSRLLS